MLPLTRKNNLSMFGAALLVAALLHAVLFSWFLLTMRGTSGQYQTSMTFWGSILRKQDLLPRLIIPSADNGGIILPGSSRMRGAAQTKAWELGVIVEKPGSGKLPDESTESTLPPKFLTERVEVDDLPADAVAGVPDAPRVFLKDPR
ncbi:MAG: hypothetical protein HQL22_02020 [Candidatus Omnitrophica bacterium]|nr:hypothetical protein [Candidatus Omnitrophota bacterium]